MARKSSEERANDLTGAFASAKKNIVVQFGSRERKTDDILKAIKDDSVSKGVNEADFQSVDVYVKPEEGKVFYVVNEKINGSVEF